MRTVFGESERELTAYFTSALGLGAQSYDSAGGGGTFDSNAALARLLEPSTQGQIRDLAAVEWTLARVDREHVTTLRLRYYPQRVGGGPFMTSLSGLASLVADTDAARKAFARWRAADPDRLGTAFGTWLDDEATANKPSPWFAVAKSVAEARLDVSLGIYDAHRVHRVRLEKAAKAQRDAQAADRHAQTIGETVRAPRARQAVLDVAENVTRIQALLAEHGDLLLAADEAS